VAKRVAEQKRRPKGLSALVRCDDKQNTPPNPTLLIGTMSTGSSRAAKRSRWLTRRRGQSRLTVPEYIKSVSICPAHIPLTTRVTHRYVRYFIANKQFMNMPGHMF
jgi:hypothetical protein